VKHPDWHHKTDLLTERYCAIEVRNANDRRALTRPPVASGDFRMWSAEVGYALEAPLLDTSQRLVGVDYELTIVGNSHRGLGVPLPLLVPAVSLISLLKLRPGALYSYEDDNGPALSLFTWRTEYDVSDYYLAWPRTWGSGIVIRLDLLAQLSAAVGAHRLVLRDFIMGDLRCDTLPSS